MSTTRDAIRCLIRQAHEPARQFDGEPAGVRCGQCGFLYATVRTPEGIGCNHCGHEDRV